MSPLNSFTLKTLSKLDLPETRARLIALEDLILSGTDQFTKQLTSQKPNLNVRWHFQDGQKLIKNQITATLLGSAIDLLDFNPNFIFLLSQSTNIATFIHQVYELNSELVKNPSVQFKIDYPSTPEYLGYEFKSIGDGGGTLEPTSSDDFIILNKNILSLFKDFPDAIKKLSSPNHPPLHFQSDSISLTKKALEYPFEKIILSSHSLLEIKEVLKNRSSTMKIEIFDLLSIKSMTELLNQEKIIFNLSSLLFEYKFPKFELIWDRQDL
jgi:nicotinate-nucleotide pyrophosphorylase (carboxylating)